MSEYGLTSKGLVIKTLDKIKSDLQSDYRSEDGFGEGINLEDNSFLGQLIAIKADRLYQIWELLQSVYNSMRRTGAEGKSLDDVNALINIFRKGIEYSFGHVEPIGTIGTVIDAGVILYVKGKPDSRFKTLANVEIIATQNAIQDIDFGSVLPNSGYWTLTHKGVTTENISFLIGLGTFFNNFDSLTANWGDGLLEAQYIEGGVSVSSSKLDLSGNSLKYVDYSAVSNADSASKGTIRIDYIPDYVNTPPVDSNIFAITKADNDTKNLISLIHESTGTFRIKVHDQNDTVKLDASVTGVTNLNLGQTYEIELGYDFDLDEIYLFIDGVNVYSNTAITGVIRNSAEIGIIRIGSNAAGTQNSDFFVDNFLVTNKRLHTLNYTAGEQIPDELYTFQESLDNANIEADISGTYETGLTLEFVGNEGNQPQDDVGIYNNLLYEQTPTGQVAVVINVSTSQIGIAQNQVSVRALEIGPISAVAGTLTEIETIVAGLTGWLNREDISVGRYVQDDDDFREESQESTQSSKVATDDAMSNALEEVENVTKALIISNRTLTTDSGGRPGKSFEAIVVGGDEDEIAQKIWDVQPAGIQSWGDITKQAIDREGNLHDIKFSRPTVIDIYVDVTVTVAPGFSVTESQIKNAILNYGSGLNVGNDVIVHPDMDCALKDLNLTDIEWKIGTSPLPTTDDNIVIDPTEIADFDSTRINVTFL